MSPRPWDSYNEGNHVELRWSDFSAVASSSFGEDWRLFIARRHAGGWDVRVEHGGWTCDRAACSMESAKLAAEEMLRALRENPRVNMRRAR